MDDCQQHADSKDDVFSMGARRPMNRPGMCCARLDDFDWVVPHYDPDTFVVRAGHGSRSYGYQSGYPCFAETRFQSCLTRMLLCRCPCLWSLGRNDRLIMIRTRCCPGGTWK